MYNKYTKLLMKKYSKQYIIPKSGYKTRVFLTVTFTEKLAEINLSPIFHEKLPSILYRAGDYALAPLENHVGVHPSIFARKCRIKLAKILNLAKRIIRKNRSVSLRTI